MTISVVDTNVILAANESHDNLSDNCIESCVQALLQVKSTGIVAVDDQYRIFSEYLKKTNQKGGKGVGDAFLKWLLQNSANPKRCIQVTLTEEGDDRFKEFPLKSRENEFDASDRKFIAVANASTTKARVLQAADCKWLDWHADLRASGIEIVFLCPDDVRRFYTSKFPGKAVPNMA